MTAVAIIERRNSPTLGCSSRCPGSGGSESKPATSLYCELDDGHKGDHVAGLLRWVK